MHVSDDPRVGTELAGYRIESLLGWGGMSVVYLAEDLRLKRKVALKLLAAGLAEDESFRDRFLRESELAASVDHPNIIPIYEAGMTEDVLFIAMRYVEGLDLKERLRRGCLDPTDAIGIVAQVASALDAAHARGLVHRDVKPSNVLLDKGARPALVVLVAAVTLTSVAAAGPAAAKQRVAIEMKLYPQEKFVLTPLQPGHLKTDSGTISHNFLSIPGRDVMRDGQKVTIYDGGVATLTGKRGTLTIRDRNVWVDLGVDGNGDGESDGIAFST